MLRFSILTPMQAGQTNIGGDKANPALAVVTLVYEDIHKNVETIEVGLQERM